MKKLICSIILPLLSIVLLCGCGETINIQDVKTRYDKLTTAYVVNNVNNFYNNEQLSKTIFINYDDLRNEIEDSDPDNDLQRRYRALYYQQLILNNIFDCYEKYHEDFYMIASSKNINEDKLKSFKSSETSLEKALQRFNQYYNSFIEEVNAGKSDIMTMSITEYSYEVNKVIDASFNFIYSFMDIYTNDCIDDINQISTKNLSISIAKANLNIAYVVYLENIKSFNFVVGNWGMCDLAPIISEDNEFLLLDLLSTPRIISTLVSENIVPGSPKYDSVTDDINNFIYSKDVFEQRLNTYKSMYNSIDVYNLTQHRFNQINGVKYDNYVDSLNASKQSSVLMIENFVSATLANYITKLNAITM